MQDTEVIVTGQEAEMWERCDSGYAGSQVSRISCGIKCRCGKKGARMAQAVCKLKAGYAIS